MVTLYGIPNCDTVKKARKLLDEKKVSYDFINFKKEQVDLTMINRWKKFMGDWPINKKGRTYRQLKDKFEGSTDAMKIKLIKQNTSLIKRPILEKGKKVMCLGIDLEIYKDI